jgi:hypothetical protein
VTDLPLLLLRIIHRQMRLVSRFSYGRCDQRDLEFGHGFRGNDRIPPLILSRTRSPSPGPSRIEEVERVDERPGTATRTPAEWHHRPAASRATPSLLALVEIPFPLTLVLQRPKD